MKEHFSVPLGRDVLSLERELVQLETEASVSLRLLLLHLLFLLLFFLLSQKAKSRAPQRPLKRGRPLT